MTITPPRTLTTYERVVLAATRILSVMFSIGVVLDVAGGQWGDAASLWLVLFVWTVPIRLWQGKRQAEWERDRARDALTEVIAAVVIIDAVDAIVTTNLA